MDIANCLEANHIKIDSEMKQKAALGPIDISCMSLEGPLISSSSPRQPEDKILDALHMHSESRVTRAASLPPINISCLSLDTPLVPSSSLCEPEEEPAESSDAVATAILPSTFMQTICDQLEFYFCDENLFNDLYLLKHMNAEGYVKLAILASFGKVQKLTTDVEQLKSSLELSTKLILSEDTLSVCRKEPLPYDQTYHGKLSRTVIAYNLPEDASIASMKEMFGSCGEISYLRLLKKNGPTGRHAVLKPPVLSGETYAIVEFADIDMTHHAVLTLSDQYNFGTGIQVVLFDGTTTDQLKQRMFPVDSVFDRRRAKSAAPSALSSSAVSSLSSSSSSSSSSSLSSLSSNHVASVGEGLEDLSEGKVSTGIIYSIRGAGGLITPSRQEGPTTLISFRLLPDEDFREGDYVSFTVGKNKKSGRKYASKVMLEYRPPFVSAAGPSSLPHVPVVEDSSLSRRRACTVACLADGRTAANTSTSATMTQRPRFLPPKGIASMEHGSPPLPPGFENSAAAAFRRAAGPDGTRGFGSHGLGRRGSAQMSPPSHGGPLHRRASREDLSAAFAQDLAGRRRAASSGTAPVPSFLSVNRFVYS